MNVEAAPNQSTAAQARWIASSSISAQDKAAGGVDRGA
jgi:hypothetical protein